MLKDDLVKAGLVVKTKTGDMKIMKGKDLEELPLGDLVVPRDDIISQKEELGRQKKAAASFYFDVADEHEVEKYKKQPDINNQAIRDYIVASAGQVMEEIDEAKDEWTKKQVERIIVSRLHEIRNLAEVRDNLAGIKNNKGEAIFIKERIDEIIGLVEARRVLVGEVIRTGKVPAIKPARKVPDRPQPSGQLKVKQKESVDSRQKNNAPTVDYQKKEMGRVEAWRQGVAGPVDELRALSLTEFRRLGANPQESADKVLAKIDLLEDQSLLKKAEGMAAWKQSEVNRLYLSIGERALAEKKPVNQVINELSTENKPYLTQVEFDEVADLNRRLSF